MVSRGGALVTGLGTLVALTIAMRPSAQAASYKVFTSSIAASTLNAGDGYCSLAEAVQSVNQGSPAYNCTDFEPGSPALITLIEASGKSYASFHYVIGTLSLNRSVRIQPSEEGFTAYIDATGTQAFTVKSGVDVNLYGLNVRHTGAANGRLIANYGTLALANTIIRNGNVKTEPLGLGGGIYSEGTLTLSSCQILSNAAKKGGGIFNKGTLNSYDTTISSNAATLAGGGIYNLARFDMFASSVAGNTSVTGGGVFNRGEMNLDSCSITGNKLTGTGSGEACAKNNSCDGLGGGVLNNPISSTSNAFFRMFGGKVATNTASYGGGLYNAGQINLDAVTIDGNSAISGGAVYTGWAGSSPYCNITNDGMTPSNIVRNIATTAGNYSIVDGTMLNCAFNDTKASCNKTAGNNGPYCLAGIAIPCPQSVPCPQ